MSNDQNGLSGIDNLTPFEYALAGVRPTSSQESPSLAVVEQMRALAEEVQDAPISQPRLQELMRGSGAGKRGDRRGFKRRRPAADGGFVDITPVELAEQNLSSSGAANTEIDEVEPINMVDATPAIFDETEPTSEQPAISLNGREAIDDLAAASAAAGEDLKPNDNDDTDPFSAGFLALGGAVANGNGNGQAEEHVTGGDLSETNDQVLDVTALDAPGLDVAPVDATETPALAETDFDREFNAIQAAMLEAEPQDEPTFYDIPIDLDPNNPSDFDSEFPFEDPPPEPDDEYLFFPSEDEPREASGRFAGDYLFADEAQSFESETPLTSQNVDDGTAVLVPAIGGEDGLILDSEPDDGRNPMPVAALTGVVPVPERRFGGAFWALAGTAAAAAVLALGGLLWANSLNESNQTESASAAQGEVADGSETDASASEGSTSDGVTTDGSTTAALDDDAEADDRPALAVDGEDTGPSTTLDPDSPSATTRDPAVGDDQTTNETAPTENPSDSTTPPEVTETTEAPETTEPETTLPPESEVTTTAPPTTQPPTTEPPPTQPPTTPAPVITPSFIGDRVTLGGFDGPGLGNVRVRLFVDSDRNGTADELVSNDVTDERGFYGFDEYPAGCYVLEFSRIPSGLTLDNTQASQSFCMAQGDQNGRFDAVAQVAPPDNCIVEASNNFSDRGVEVHENDFDRADSYTFYNQNGGVVLRTSQVGGPDDLDNDSPYGDYEWFAEESGFNHRNVRSVAAERFGVESTPITCERQ